MHILYSSRGLSPLWFPVPLRDRQRHNDIILLAPICILRRLSVQKTKRHEKCYFSRYTAKRRVVIHQMQVPVYAFVTVLRIICMYIFKR